MVNTLNKSLARIELEAITNLHSRVLDHSNLGFCYAFLQPNCTFTVFLSLNERFMKFDLPSFTSLHVLNCNSFKEPAWIISLVIMPNMDF